MPYINSLRKNYNALNEKAGSLLENFEITGGDSVFTAGGYRIHMFTSVGDAELAIRQIQAQKSNTMNLQSATVDIEYLVLAGGGGGGLCMGGGGGAGGFQTGNSSLNAGSYPTSVGSGTGGSGSRANSGPGRSGNPSSFNSVTSVGGGGGSSWDSGGGNVGGPGGSRGCRSEQQ